MFYGVPASFRLHQHAGEHKDEGYTTFCCCFHLLPQISPKSVTRAFPKPQIYSVLAVLRSMKGEKGTCRDQRCNCCCLRCVSLPRLVPLKPSKSAPLTAPSQQQNITACKWLEMPFFNISLPVSHFMVPLQEFIPSRSSSSKSWQSASDGFLVLSK